MELAGHRRVVKVAFGQNNHIDSAFGFKVLNPALDTQLCRAGAAGLAEFSIVKDQEGGGRS